VDRVSCLFAECRTNGRFNLVVCGIDGGCDFVQGSIHGVFSLLDARRRRRGGDKKGGGGRKMMSFLFFTCFFSEKEKGGTFTGLIHSFPPRTMSSHDAPKTAQLR
jgi:hypothetical protein